jgi:protein-S-isoprenylcysteine O-methyltransferase Ste14
MKKRMLPPTYFFTSIVVMVLLHFVFPLSNVIVYPWNLLGCALLGIGIGLNLVADRAFKEHQTTVKPFQESTVLVTTGVFQFTRNPMYFGIVLMLLGIAFLMGTLTPFIVIPVFAVLIQSVFIKVEEQMLEEKFGRTWAEYKQKVRRWI